VASVASFPAARISCVVGENEAVADAASSSELRAGEKRAAEAVLTRAWGDLLAPFPSCWCFADLPGEVGAPAVEAYRETLGAAGIGLGTDWVAGVAAALAGWIVARGRTLTEVLDEDSTWGTTTMRPRLLAWLRNFIDRADGGDALPRLRALIALMHEQLSSRWPGVRVPEYPALARPGSEPVPVPDWWPPRPGQKMDP
jgi:hypothetical protein